MSVDPLELEWGPATIESTNETLRIAVHVFNHDLGTPECVRKNVRFARGRIAWFAKHLPERIGQVVAFDDRGQDVSPSVRDELKRLLASSGARVVFFSEGLKDVL
jgi:hypothetical protein